MMIRNRSALLAPVAALALSIPFTASAQEAERVMPGASPWNLDMAEESCALRRIFGNEEQSIFLEMRQFAPGDGFRVMLYSDELEGARGEVIYTLHPDGEELRGRTKYSVSVGRNGEGASFTWGLYRTDNYRGEPQINEDSEDFDTDRPPLTEEEMAARSAAITAISIEGVFEDAVRLETGSMEGPLQVMRQCLDDLVAHWGLDVEAHRTLTRSVEPVDQNRWVRRIIERYPTQALRREQEAALHVRLSINTEGGVDQCIIQAGLGEPVFEETACNVLMQSARFLLALDAEGTAIPSYWATSIFYAIN